jgi:phospholipid/cholesterol/gamma-HCH transport system ATP-binding protein
MIILKDVTKSIGGKIILKNINLEVQKGETLAIIGPSGCGKSTLLKNIIGLSKPDTGEIIIFGENIVDMSEVELNRIRKKIGMVFQEGALFDSLSVYENVSFALRWHSKLKEEEIRKIVKEKLELLGLENTENLMPAQLSGGMRRRVGIARALVFEPEIVLFDEPTTGLDPIMKNVINRYILELKNKLKITSIVVTHDIDTANYVADKIGMLYEGELIFFGTQKDLENSENPVVKRFIKGDAK